MKLYLELVEKLKKHLAKTNDNNMIQSKGSTNSENSYPINISQEDLANLNLNKLTTEELNKYKAEMEKEYIKNAINPESDNFIYDVQKEFNIENCNNDWDDEDEEI